ncbi:CocE/NonD family hydrolase [Pseudoalteromonas luteoviolacea]|uniref:CocE/NonD family hydrolase n=1 Tax=Pseudoalteromonas luteoviolacea TaxID=43657 RepID=UPI001EEF0561|nr:CocE/NonD family hydrolase [Pseudoalteromonas luteoviolacea]MCF6442274.1 CocE/NonD family hydrolase [Pseudoalteromonas luteoviolacea]
MCILSKIIAKVIALIVVFLAMSIPHPTQAAKNEQYRLPTKLIELLSHGETNITQIVESELFFNSLLPLIKQLPSEAISKQPDAIKASLSLILQGSLDLSAQSNLTAHSTLAILEYQQFYSVSNKESHQLTFKQQIMQKLDSLNYTALYQYENNLNMTYKQKRKQLANTVKDIKGVKALSEQQLIKLASSAMNLKVSKHIYVIAQPLIQKKWQEDFIIEPAYLITTKQGVEHTATIVRPKNRNKTYTAAFQFTIYADESRHIKTAKFAALQGYVGIVVNSRGKRLSKNKIEPWVNEGIDTHRLIDWISKQSWSDGQVVMYGGSYNGYTQWAAAKYKHPALKAIAPYTAAHPALGLPMENNVFLTANYQWGFHVTNNKTMDNSEYANRAHWNNLNKTLFTSGRAFKDIDKIEGRPNPLFQKFLSHPSFDDYYKSMVPYGEEFADINIPVLSITGYFDGGQISAIHYMKEHYKYNPKAKHSLLIGPYDHWTAQALPNSHVTNYKLDPVALQKDTEKVVFEWFDHVLNNAPAPDLVKNKINYQLMGNNTWHHVDSYEQLNQQGIDFYLGTPSKSKYQSLLKQKPNPIALHTQVVDLADRKIQHNIDYMNVILPKLPDETGVVFVSDAFEQDMQYAGAPSGHVFISINKKDVDIGFNLYQLMPDGQTFHLAHYRSRASYANNSSKRQLLTPNQKTKLPLVNTRMTARKLIKGSRLALVLDVNKNEHAQVNMGTGKDVSVETIDDAKEPLILKWFTDSKIHLPITRLKKI